MLRTHGRNRIGRALLLVLFGALLTAASSPSGEHIRAGYLDRQTEIEAAGLIEASDFSKGEDGWAKNKRAYAKRDKYHIKGPSSEWWGSWRSFPSKRVVVQVDVKVKKSKNLDKAFGIMFRKQEGPWDEYNFFITPAGNFGVERTENKNSHTTLLKNWSPHPAIFPMDTKKWNRLEIRAWDGTMDFFINGEKVARVHDSTYGSGDIGLAAGPDQHILFDNFRLYHAWIEGVPKGESEKTFFEKGKALSKKKKYREAVKQFDLAIKLAPNYDAAYYNRAFCLNKLGEIQRAVKDMDTAILLSPKGDYYCNRGFYKSRLERYPEAVRDYEKAIKKNPQKPLNYKNRGWSYINLTEFDKALEDFNKTVQLDPENGGSYYARATARLYKGNFKGALEDLNTAVEKGFDKPMLYDVRTMAYLMTGNPDRAARDSEHILSVEGIDDKTGLRAMLTGYVSYQELGRDGDAARILKKASGYDEQEWYYQMVRYLRGDISPETLIEKAGKDTDRLTDAYGILGLNYRFQEKYEPAREHMQWVLENGNPSRYYYLLAAKHLPRLPSRLVIKSLSVSPDPAFPGSKVRWIVEYSRPAGIQQVQEKWMMLKGATQLFKKDIETSFTMSRERHSESRDFTIPSNAAPGVYILRLRAQTGKDSASRAEEQTSFTIR